MSEVKNDSGDPAAFQDSNGDPTSPKTDSQGRLEKEFDTVRITTATTTVVKNAPGKLGRIRVEGGTTGTITIYDNTSAAGTILMALDTTNALQTFECDQKANIGITVVTSAATKVAVMYN